MDPSDLLEHALQQPDDTADRILYALAAFTLLIEGDCVLVGGAAQVTHTGIARPTDIDVVGVVTAADELKLAEAGFERAGRHWVVENAESAIAIEVPESVLDGEEAPEEFDVEGVTVRVISVTDLMMDRLRQATDGKKATRDEATQLAIAAGDAIDWARLERQAKKLVARQPTLGDLPTLIAELQKMATSDE